MVAVVKKEDPWLKLVHMKQFPLGTAYASVIGYIKVLCEKLQGVSRILVDQTGVGEYIVEDMISGGISGVEGVVLTVPKKQEVLGNLKSAMETGHCVKCGRSYPSVLETKQCVECRDPEGKPVPVRPLLAVPYDPDLIAELNVERFELTKSGQVQFSHPDGTHDDRLWALALAVYAARTAEVTMFGSAKKTFG